MSRSRVDDRAEKVYAYLLKRLGESVTIAELCKGIGAQDGSTTRAAIRRARNLAAEAGYHFPPAVPETGSRYMVTDLASDAIIPTAHTQRIETGVRIRKEAGIEFMRRERGKLPSDMRPIIDMQIVLYDEVKKALASIQKAGDDMAVALIKAHREGRESRDDK